MGIQLIFLGVKKYSMFDCSSFVNQGPVVQKPINLIQDFRKIWLHSGQLFVESFFCLILFLKIDFF